MLIRPCLEKREIERKTPSHNAKTVGCLFHLPRLLTSFTPIATCKPGGYLFHLSLEKQASARFGCFSDCGARFRTVFIV